MPDINDKIIKVILVGNVQAGKTALMRRLTSGYFTPDYKPTIGVDLGLLPKDSMKFQIWDLPGDERCREITKTYYRLSSIVVYVLDATKDVEENKQIFQEFNSEISSEISISHCLQLLIFNKSDDNSSKLSQDYISEFDIFNIPHVICSAKAYGGIAALEKYFNDVSGLVSTKKEAEEELLLSKIEQYSKKLLSKKYSQIAKDKSTALNAIAEACRQRGMGQRQVQTFLSQEQITEIKGLIRDEQKIIRRHRHWSMFNCFFNVIDAINPSVLARRVESSKLVTELNGYLDVQDNLLSSTHPAYSV